jgi:hypothetical protein
MLALAGGDMMETLLQNVEISSEWDFRADHTLHSQAHVSAFGQNRETTQTGTWMVESAGENQLTVSITAADGKTSSVVIAFVDDNNITVTGNVPGVGDQQAKFIRMTTG